MALPKTIDVPLEELDRAKNLEEVKTVLKKYLRDSRQNHEELFATLQTKQDKE